MAQLAVQISEHASTGHSPPLSRPGSLHAEFINANPEYRLRLQAEWEQFARELPNREPFTQPYWFQAFANTIAKGEVIPMVIVRDAAGIRGVLPLRRTGKFLGRVPARVLSGLSNVHSCRYDLSCQPADRVEVARAAWSALKREPSWNVLEATAVPQGGVFEEIMRFAEEDGYLTSRWPTLLSPYLMLPSSDSDPFSNCPARYRKDRKRLENRFAKLKDHGEVSFAVYPDFDEQRFQGFLHLEGSGWKGAAGGAIKCNPVLVEFYRELLTSAAARGHLRCFVLSLGEKPIAMEVGLVIDGVCFSPKVAYHEGFRNTSPGQQLARLTIADLVRCGVTKYDLLGARARHKALWAGEVRPHANCYIIRPSFAGKVYHFIVDTVGPRVKKFKHARKGDPQSLGDG